MAHRPQHVLRTLLALAYTLSVTVCACHSLAAVAKSGVRECCSHKSEHSIPSTPGFPAESKECPHCNAAAPVATSDQLLKQMDQSDPALVAAVIPPPTLCAPSIARCCDSMADHFIAPTTLLGLHCALVT